jgi:site-specific recombinase XerD
MRGSDSLTIEETDGLIQAVVRGTGGLAIRDKMLLELMASTGLRVSEVCALRVDQVLDAGRALPTLHLVRKETKRAKGGKLPLAEKLQGSLEGYGLWLRTWSDSSWLFPGYDGKHLSPRAVQMRIKALAQAAGIRKKITPHSLRKFYIQRLMDGGLDLRNVMELSRHSSLSSLHHYLVVDEQKGRDAVEKIR